MPLLTVCYVKGRCGATTTALGLVAVAPAAARAVLVECDPAGGDLVYRHRLAAKPSLVDLAAAARNSTGPTGDSDPLTMVTQNLVLRDRAVDVVVAPAGGAQTRAALPELTRPGHLVLKPAHRVVIADCGRWEPSSPARPLVRAADVSVVLARARTDELAHLREHLGELIEHTSGRLVVLLGAGGVYPDTDVAEVLAAHLVHDLARATTAVTVIGPLPSDRRAAVVLGGDLLAGPRWRRLPLMSALSRLLMDLSPHLAITSRRRVEGRPVGTGVIR